MANGVCVHLLFVGFSDFGDGFANESPGVYIYIMRAETLTMCKNNGCLIWMFTLLLLCFSTSLLLCFTPCSVSFCGESLIYCIHFSISRDLRYCININHGQVV